MTDILVVFPNLWITDVATLVSVNVATPTRIASADLSGSVHFYAGGRRRVITTPGDTVTYPLTLQWVSDPDTLQLMAWRGRVLLMRDTLGRRVFGTYLQVDQSDVSRGAEFWHDVTITFTELDYDEGV
jgi:hypothetical protein